MSCTLKPGRTCYSHLKYEQMNVASNASCLSILLCSKLTEVRPAVHPLKNTDLSPISGSQGWPRMCASVYLCVKVFVCEMKS